MSLRKALDILSDFFLKGRCVAVLHYDVIPVDFALEGAFES